MSLTRRQFNAKLGQAAAVAAAFGIPSVALGNKKAKIVVVGGGAGGATAAKYIAKDAADTLEVILIEPATTYITCFHSNLVLGGVKTLDEISHTYDRLASAYGLKHIQKRAKSIDRTARRVTLDDGTAVDYDALVLSPGVDLKYDSVPGWGKEHEEVMPHAWKAGPQTLLLKSKLDAVPDGGVILMLAPPNPYRCPPGPYERVSMMAHTLKRAGKTKCKIVILDPKEKFSKQALFMEGWDKHYPGMVEWLSKDIYDGIENVDPATNTVATGFETYKNAALVNVIPAQMAGSIARDAGLANETGFCPINPDTMQSALDPNIYIVGDACISGDMPKSAFAANSQAKVAAASVRAQFVGSKSFPARYQNICWSMIDSDDSIKVGGRYVAKDGKISSIEDFVSKTGEDASVRKMTQTENMGWYEGITADIFL
ncbi:NAD(P)/FAD-dependent oxidoreductase [Hyphomicrobium sp.]|uniref:NAD(P)/FAD-dependent oxidoreductase n=1 Tax=Hyphomicrobium sp. TaxID=82 RepID=UPI002E34B914|nr:NAD(P)/FAD-dependent oxidoreductase [Hyphomicrobium sp.]HEX2841255.1 NAD(P)/FAD-dependent oxidoreductase [Hyphomicrobium sp.]